MAPSAVNPEEQDGFGEADVRHPPPNGHNASGINLNAPGADDVTIREHHFGVTRRLRIAMIGAGMSGLNFFKFAEERMDNVDITCFEKNSDVGGTWLENRYPGCACGKTTSGVVEILCANPVTRYPKRCLPVPLAACVVVAILLAFTRNLELHQDGGTRKSLHREVCQIRAPCCPTSMERRDRAMDSQSTEHGNSKRV